MNEILDNKEMEIPCSECKRMLKEKIGRIRKSPVLICPGCKTKIQIRFDDSDLKKLEKAIANLDKEFRKLGGKMGGKITTKM